MGWSAGVGAAALDDDDKDDEDEDSDEGRQKGGRLRVVIFPNRIAAFFVIARITQFFPQRLPLLRKGGQLLSSLAASIYSLHLAATKSSHQAFYFAFAN